MSCEPNNCSAAAAARSTGRGHTTVVGSDETGSDAAAAGSAGRGRTAAFGSDEMDSVAAAAAGNTERSNVDMNIEKTVAAARNT